MAKVFVLHNPDVRNLVWLGIISNQLGDEILRQQQAGYGYSGDLPDSSVLYIKAETLTPYQRSALAQKHLELEISDSLLSLNPSNIIEGSVVMTAYGSTISGKSAGVEQSYSTALTGIEQMFSSIDTDNISVDVQNFLSPIFSHVYSFSEITNKHLSLRQFIFDSTHVSFPSIAFLVGNFKLPTSLGDLYIHSMQDVYTVPNITSMSDDELRLLVNLPSDIGRLRAVASNFNQFGIAITARLAVNLDTYGPGITGVFRWLKEIYSQYPLQITDNEKFIYLSYLVTWIYFLQQIADNPEIGYALSEAADEELADREEKKYYAELEADKKMLLEESVASQEMWSQKLKDDYAKLEKQFRESEAVLQRNEAGEVAILNQKYSDIENVVSLQFDSEFAQATQNFLNDLAAKESKFANDFGVVLSQITSRYSGALAKVGVLEGILDTLKNEMNHIASGYYDDARTNQVINLTTGILNNLLDGTINNRFPIYQDYTRVEDTGVSANEIFTANQDKQGIIGG